MRGLREKVKGLLADMRQRWYELPRAARLNVALYAFTGLSMLALVVELAAGAVGGSDVSSATADQEPVSTGPGTTLRDRRPGTTVVRLPTSVTVGPVTTVAPPTTLPEVFRSNTTRPVRRPAPTTPPPAPVETVAPAPPTTEAPPVTTVPPTRPTTPTTVDADPFQPDPPVIPTFP